MAEAPSESVGIGASVLRNEDARLLTGKATFVDDIDLPEMVHCAFVRSPHAHARLRHIDVTAAAKRDGVLAIYTAADLGDYWQAGPLLVPPPPIKDLVFHPRTQVPLAKNKVRCVGEPIAIVVAIDRYVAEDAAGEIVVDYEPLDAVVDLEKALQAGHSRVHDDLDSNLATHARQTKGDYATATRDAHKQDPPAVRLRPWRLQPDGDQGHRGSMGQ